jgi:hypothetical protein
MVLNGASAEVGRTNSGYLNVVTKSGTNDYHGAAFYQNRNGTLTSPDAFGNDSSSNSQHQFGGSFGGPVRRTRCSFSALSRRTAGRVIFRVDDVDAHHRALQAQGLMSEWPQSASWVERFFHVTHPDGHELSFAEPLLAGTSYET